MKNIFRDEVKPYDKPRFPIEVVKEAFEKDGTFYIMKESKGFIEFMKKGYKATEGFQFCFKDADDKAYDEDCDDAAFPVGEAVLIGMQPWVAVDWADAADYKSVQEMIDEANWCIEKYGKKFKIKEVK